MNEQVEIKRDCEAIAIPQGNKITIPVGTRAWITQALGDTFTLQVPNLGGLFRVAGSDADALGKEPLSSSASAPQTAGVASEAEVWEALRNVYDPEIPVNVVDLGLIYDMSMDALPSGGRRVQVKMTLTAPGCGMGPSIAMDAKYRIENLPGVEEADVQLVWDPPWNPHMISADGRAKLGME